MPRPALALALALVLALVLVLGPTACVRTEPGPSLRLGPEPTVAGGVFSSGGGLVVAAELRDIEGRAGVCGVWAKSNQSVLTKGYNRQVIESGVIFLDGERVVQGLGFLPEVALARDYGGAPGRCVLIGRDWDPALADAAFLIRIPRQNVAYDGDGEIASGGGTLVTFRQTSGFPVGP